MAGKIKNIRFGWDSELCLFFDEDDVFGSKDRRIYLTATSNDEGKTPEDLIVEAINLSIDWDNRKHGHSNSEITTHDLMNCFPVRPNTETPPGPYVYGNRTFRMIEELDRYSFVFDLPNGEPGDVHYSFYEIMKSELADPKQFQEIMTQIERKNWVQWNPEILLELINLDGHRTTAK